MDGPFLQPSPGSPILHDVSRFQEHKRAILLHTYQWLLHLQTVVICVQCYTQDDEALSSLQHDIVIFHADGSYALQRVEIDLVSSQASKAIKGLR